MATETQNQSSVPFVEFEKRYNAREAQILWHKSVNDTDTPVSAYLKITEEEKNSFLLESVEGGENLGRYSIIGMKPDLIWRAKDGIVRVNPIDKSLDVSSLEELPMLDSLRCLLNSSQITLPKAIEGQLPPMFAGVFGFFGYDTVNQTEVLPVNDVNDLEIDDAIFIRPSLLAVFDNVKREITFITPIWPSRDRSAKEAYETASNLLRIADASLEKAISTSKELNAPHAPDFTSNVSENEFYGMVERAKEYIRAGDIFQVVLSQRFSTPFSATPFSLYRSLRRLNPSPFLFFLNFDDCALVGSSPEILVRVREGEVTIRPIAGTRPRGSTPEEDKRLEEDLLADPKELAEHLMLLDLGRNDVGRSSKLGSVKVTDDFTIERYSHVMHIVSNVIGELSDKSDAVEALMAGFPAGTVSGAPKIRAMEIIAELEKDRRGPYAGCIGYFSADGNLDTCIALRTAVIKDGKMHVQAGAGIVADSDPAAENQECINKASALFKAAQLV